MPAPFQLNEMAPDLYCISIRLILDQNLTNFKVHNTPFSLSELIAGLVMGQRVQELADGAPYVTLDEPTCGAGGMVIAAAKVLLDRGYNPQTQLLVQCTDLDPVAARMCFVQLSLLGIPACVRIGNSLSQKITREMYTPFWYRIKGSCRTF